MASGLLGRLAGLSRTFFAGLHTELQLKTRPTESLHLVTGSSGFSKTISQSPTFKQWTYGDDAYFVAKNRTADVIGVADGVGGWRNYGIDPSAFPRSLMETCERMVREGRFNAHAPATVIAASYYELQEMKTPLIGSSTACIVALHKKERRIYTANLGDSGFLLIRDDKVVHRSQEQQHYFNTPFQLAVAPPSQAGLVLSDSPDMAESSSFDVEEGDIILLGTDGLFDNMNEDMILDCLSKMKDHRDSEVNVQRTAHHIAEEAYQLSFDQDYLSPFALSAQQRGIDLKGGKPDDITVLLARVSSCSNDQNVEI
ncbi:protein phosphatase PTC7 homolog [Saccostrea echinata]|uniref:protein phosphatase PTC7 homolog n=1 Tax=Saccostrea echinata TaxID=191078 RepID=UPI002A829486|nr:protein phosphatase PTC7 homolog [Saccostrea echinata]